MTFRWPWVSAARYDDIERSFRDRLAEKDTRITQLERERQRLWDRFAQNAIGGQVFDTIPEVQAAPELPLTPDQQRLREDAAKFDRLRVMARYHPSQLGAEMERGMAEDTLRSIEAAQAKPQVVPPQVQEFFDTARTEAVGNGNGNH